MLKNHRDFKIDGHFRLKKNSKNIHVWKQLHLHTYMLCIHWLVKQPPTPPQKKCIGFTNTHKIHGTGIYTLHENPLSDNAKFM